MTLSAPAGRPTCKGRGKGQREMEGEREGFSELNLYDIKQVERAVIYLE
jgi:hypothetical protein